MRTNWPILARLAQQFLVFLEFAFILLLKKCTVENPFSYLLVKEIGMIIICRPPDC